MAGAFRPVNSSLLGESIKEEPMTTSSSSSVTPRPSAASQHPSQPQQSRTLPDDSKTPTRSTFSSAVSDQKPLPNAPFPPTGQASEPADGMPRRENSQHSTKSSRRDSMDVDMDDSDGETGAGGDDGTISDGDSHAQTVHVNEDIPTDSLAATGSRFQRQMRTTDRVRQAGNRARASTGGSAGGPVRGHSKSLSTSSIASISSVGSGYGPQMDVRRRPPPLVMAADPRSRMSLESYRSNADSTFSYRPPSPGDFSTPTSATFSTAQSSPRWMSGMASPTSSHSRSQSMYSSGNRTPGRRLSVPSSANPFQSAPGRALFSAGHLNSSHPSAFSPAGSSLVTSPTSSTSGWSTRRDSVSSNGDDAWRRRTWHPDSRTQSNQLAGQQQQPPQQHGPSAMAIDSETAYRRSFQPGVGEAVQLDERRNLNMYDASLQRGLNRLDISHKTPPRDSAGSWASEANRAVQAQAERVQMQTNQPSVRFQDQVPPSRQFPASVHSGRSLHQHTMSAPSIATPRENKRHGWYHGPAPSQAPGEHVMQDARGAHVDRMVHPNFTGFSGFPGREQPAQTQQQDGKANPDSLRRLEALVAVATSEGTTATAY
ncbi:C2H2 type zinc finger containing protein [Metarhizium acridum CQMa 102]|uniref:C2H2 type zinc finger containing protein n=1 Tax=Metarhizium acridum (strain CQMa 102) TaxID=655827 RepID=E9EH67_METAQ|nr:C2H2 type zinc finger containing protein [Metarhizium acridum CQMa 102]EFY84731.1 C2H2 type zinc finger containing protein [Metarhizium acridum CQMa 102]